MKAILVIDTGSSSMRGILFSELGEMLYTCRDSYCMDTGPGGMATYCPDDFERCLVALCEQCVQQAKRTGISIEALSFTSQRSSTMPISRDGKPMDLFMTWYDKRSASICEQINAHHGRRLHQLCGMQATPVLSAPKILWLLQHQPALYAQAYKIIGIHDYLIYLCTGRLVTDVTLASRTNLMDIRALRWSDEALEIYGLDGDKLVELMPPCSVVGETTRAWSERTGLPAGTPVISAGGDQQCSVLGQGLMQVGDAGVTCGSGAYMTSVVESPRLDEAQRVNLTAAVTPGQWVLEASTLSCGTVQDWFLKTLYHEFTPQKALEIMHDELKDSSPGAHGLYMFTCLAGTGCPDWNDQARGMFCNLSFVHTRTDFARAMLEGLCAEIAECYHALRQLTPIVGAVRATGGLAQYPLMNHILADMIDFPVKQCNNKEATAIGAFLAAAYALGYVDSPAKGYTSLSNRLDDCGELYMPDSQNAACYRQMNQARRRIYEAIPHALLQAIENTTKEERHSEKQP